MATSVLEGIQEVCQNRLLADPYFTNVPVLRENLGDIETQIQIAIAELGIVAILVTPTASVQRLKDVPGPYFERINIVVQVSENVLLNRSPQGTNKTALDVCEDVLVLLHGFIPTNIIEPVYASDPTISLVPDPNGLLTYHVSLETHGGLGGYLIPAVETPIVSFSGGNCAISTSTPHAQLFYTTSALAWPSPRSGTYYSGPFAVSSGATVRVKGYLAGYTDSLLATSVAP